MKIFRLLIIPVIALVCTVVHGQTPDTTQVKMDSASVAPPPPPPAPAPQQQEGQGRAFNEKFAFGFGTGFWVDTRETYIELSPIVAYRFPKRLTTGVGYRYIYRHDRVFDRDLNSYGPNVFARLDILKRIYFWTEYEILKTEYLNEIDNGTSSSKDNEQIDSWFAGLGYVRSVGRRGRGGISFQVLYNVLYSKDDKGPYYYPITYRVGYFF